VRFLFVHDPAPVLPSLLDYGHFSCLLYRGKLKEKQLRLGLGQVLRYCQLLQTKGKVHGVLAIERAPSDATWLALCESHNILLVWPEVFSEKLKT
jgi:hypothetical protein